MIYRMASGDFRAAERRSAAIHGLRALSPQGTLDRGYAIARDGDGNVVTRASALSKGDVLNLRFGMGNADARVSSVSPSPQK